MTATNPIPPATSPTTPAAAAAPKSSTSSGRLAATKSKVDSAEISKAGHAAADAEKVAKPTLTSAQALALGVKLAVSNPTKFQRADSNGDGKLSAQEAKQAGLG